MGCDSCDKLSSTEADLFRHKIAKLLFLCNEHILICKPQLYSIALG